MGHKHAVLGALLNFNTIESFKECDKSDLIQKYAGRLEQSWSSEKDEAPKFILISFAVWKMPNLIYSKDCVAISLFAGSEKVPLLLLVCLFGTKDSYGSRCRMSTAPCQAFQR